MIELAAMPLAVGDTALDESPRGNFSRGLFLRAGNTRDAGILTAMKGCLVGLECEA